MATLTSKLVVQLLDQVTGPSRGVVASIDKLTAASRANARRLEAVRGQMLGAAGAGYALARGLAAPINAAVAFESTMADVRKVVDFPTPKAFAQMGADIRALSLRIPVAADGLGQIVAAAGQSGIANKNLLQFTELAAKTAVAWDVPAGVAGDALAKMRTALGLTIDQTGLLADSINVLGNNTAAASPDILKFTKSAAPAARTFGLSGQQAAAFGAAMIGAGFDANVAATSFQNMGRALTRGASATKRQRGAFKQLGLSSTEVAKRMQSDAVGTIQDVLSRIRALPKELQAAAISDLFGNEARALAPLINNADLLGNTLDLVAEKSRYAGSAAKEYARATDTTGNAMQLFQNRINDLGISIGDALLPGLNVLLARIGPIITSIGELAQRFPNVTRAIIGVTAGFIALRVAAIVAQFAFFWMKGGLISTAIVGFRGLRGALLGVGGAFRIAGRAARGARGAIAGASMLGAVGGGGILSGLVAGVGTAVSAIMGALTGLAAGVAAVTAPIWGIIAAVVAAVLGLALAIYNYWVPISKFVSGFVSVIYDALSGLVSTIAGFGARIAAAVGGWVVDRVVDIAGLLGIDEATVRAAIDAALAAISGFASSAVAFIKSIPAKVGGWIADIFTMNTYSDAATAGFRSAGERAGQALVDAVKAAINAMIDWFKNLPRRIIAAIGKIDLSSVIKLPSLPSWLGGSGGESPAVAGARAAGGAVKAGNAYLVGEEGPELVTFGRNGFVHDAVKTARIAALAASATALPLPAIAAPAAASPQASQAPSITIASGAFQFTIQAAPGQSPEEVAEAVERVLSEKLTGLYNGAFHDGVN